MSSSDAAFNPAGTGGLASGLNDMGLLVAGFRFSDGSYGIFETTIPARGRVLWMAGSVFFSWAALDEPAGVRNGLGAHRVVAQVRLSIRGGYANGGNYLRFLKMRELFVSRAIATGSTRR